jgi:hypothetical protein
MSMPPLSFRVVLAFGYLYVCVSPVNVALNSREREYGHCTQIISRVVPICLVLRGAEWPSAAVVCVAAGGWHRCMQHVRDDGMRSNLRSI